ncbi:MAG: hypothetical protein CMP75_03590 [Flavobacteriales bacterium]|nr:hypothetical protein [Flavobacteriales bacterium]
MSIKELEMKKIESCGFCQAGLRHICKEEENQDMPKVLADFGAVGKAVQSLPKEEEMDKPYWASSHQYDDSIQDWGKHEIVVTEFQQSGLTHHFGVISLGVADAICRVPALPAATRTLEICKRTLDGEVTGQYQRPLEFDRIENIEKFLTTSPTIVNPVILEISKGALKNGSASITGEGIGKRLVINLQQIEYIKNKLKDVDLVNGIDHRPIDLVDGQHRIRSSRLSIDAMNMLIPFVVVDSEYDGGGGRIFAEINVQSNDLATLHKLHLRYVLKLASHQSTEDYGHVPQSFIDNSEEFDDKWTKIFETRFANRMAYRVGAKLTLNPKSALYDMILFYGKAKDESMKKVTDAYEWVAHCNPWVMQFPELASSEDVFVRTIQNYFQAWKITANIDPKTGISYHDVEINNRWGKGQGNSEKSTLYSKMFNAIMFKSIMALFPLSYKLSGIDMDSTDEEMIQSFLKVLQPCRPIDGLDLDAWETIMQTGSSATERENHIYHWMSWAIYDYHRTGKLVAPELAWNIENGEPTEVPSAPGQGFFSPVNSDFFAGTLKVEGISDDYWEGLNQATITVRAEEIPNESIAKTISIIYYDKDGKERLERRTKHTKGPRKAIGYNFLSQLFQTSTKTHGVSAVEITVSSGNLFSGLVPIFRQKYSIDELRLINNSGLVIGSTPITSYSSVDDVIIEQFQTETESDVSQYVVSPTENYTPTEIEEPSPEEIDQFFSAPPPRNTCYQTWKEFNYRRAHRPVATPCMGCLSGAHNEENCGYRRYY